MKTIEIRALKTNERLSDETLCFSATIYVDGKRVGDAANRGTGGQTEIHIASRDLIPAMKAWAVAHYRAHGTDQDRALLFAPSESGYVPDPLEYLIDDLVDQEHARKATEREAKRIARTEEANRRDFAARGLAFMVRANIKAGWVWYGCPADDAATVARCVAAIAKKHGPVTDPVVLSTKATP